MSRSVQFVISVVMIITGIWLMELSACSHPTRFSPACFDAPANTECH